MFVVVLFCFSGFMKSIVAYAAPLWDLRQWPDLVSGLTSLHNFKKPSDIFWPQIERKRSEENLVLIVAVKRNIWAIFLPRVHIEK